uniref:F-box only protein n=1 Tax=Petromyzon marinus TaxID=7757 RepID=S4R7H3_PETMA
QAEGDKDHLSFLMDDSDDEQEAASEKNLNEQLEAFRERWRSELKGGRPGGGTAHEGPLPGGTAPQLPVPSPVQPGSQDRAKTTLGAEEQARELFIRAAELEQEGALYEAIKFYRQAMQLVPDIEFRVNDYGGENGSPGDMDNREAVEDNAVTNLLTSFQSELSLQEAQPKLCRRDTESRQTHISALPVEVLVYVFRWVVSSDLDLRSLEQLSMVCRGFYMCARSLHRDPEIWRLACLRVWGRNTGKPSPYLSWRHMFLERTRLRYDGTAPSASTSCFQSEGNKDVFVDCLHISIYYYMYLRFFPDGLVMMLTTPDDPQSIVSRLRTKHTRIDAVLYGHFRMTQDTNGDTRVLSILTKRPDKEPIHKKDKHSCQVTCRWVHVGIGARLEAWGEGIARREGLTFIKKHSMHFSSSRATGETVVSNFDIDKKYASFFFSRVKSFTAFSEGPL